MTVELDVLISILRLATDGPISYELINKDANAPSAAVQKLLQTLQNEGLLYAQRRLVIVDGVQRVRLAMRAIFLGADVESASCHLRWNEFEDFAATVLTLNGYAVSRNLRFKSGQHRWEIDVVGSKKPLVICIDCKHWKHGLSPGSLGKMAEKQVERTSALARIWPPPGRLEGACWDSAKLVPAVLTISTTNLRFYRNVPIVSVLQLQDFLTHLRGNVDSLFSVDASTNKLDNAT